MTCHDWCGLFRLVSVTILRPSVAAQVKTGSRLRRIRLKDRLCRPFRDMSVNEVFFEKSNGEAVILLDVNELVTMSAELSVALDAELIQDKCSQLGINLEEPLSLQDFGTLMVACGFKADEETEPEATVGSDSKEVDAAAVDALGDEVSDVGAAGSTLGAGAFVSGGEISVGIQSAAEASKEGARAFCGEISVEELPASRRDEMSTVYAAVTQELSQLVQEAADAMFREHSEQLPDYVKSSLGNGLRKVWALEYYADIVKEVVARKDVGLGPVVASEETAKGFVFCGEI